ncbi:MAG: response regulator, partial [Rhodospirillales bacterium]|nr:response regulator [Rhodospirillales bacterium]
PVTVNLYDLYHLHKAEKAEIDAEARRALSLVDGELARLIEGSRQILYVLSHSIAVHERILDECHSLMARLTGGLPDYEELHVTDESDRILCSTEPAAVGLNLLQGETLRQAAAETGFAIGTYVIRNTTGRPAVTMVLPYLLARGDTGGLISMTMEVRGLRRQLSQLTLPAGGFLTVADRDGTVLVDLPQGKPMGAALPPMLMNLSHQTTAGLTELDDGRGGRRLVAFTPAGGALSGLFVAIGLKEEPVATGLRASSWRGLTTTALSLILALLIVRNGHRRLLRHPVRSLTESVARWSQGDYEARAEVPRAPELAVLARAFNAMADTLAEREQAGAAARESERRMAEVLASTTDGVIKVDTDWRISFANNRVRNLTESSRELVGQLLWEAFPEAKRILASRACLDQEAGGNAVEFEEYFPSRQTWFHIRAFPMAHGLAIYFEDISRGKATEQALEAAKFEAEQANLSKSKFLAAASHDLRQPVQSLMLFASALSQHLRGHPAAPVVAHIERAAMALKTLLDDLLEISRLEAGIITPRSGAVDLAALLGEMNSEYAPRAAARGLVLKVVPCRRWVRSDPALLGRILRNLIENALKYTSGGMVLVGCRNRAGRLSIEVHDTGIGIAADKLDLIFEEFQQLDNPERDRAKGLGLGLAIVQRLTRLLDHDLLVRSRPGKGSCFAVQVPLSAPPAPSARCPPCESRQGGLAVVVEDEEEVRAGLQMQLEAWGYEVISGTDHCEVLPRLGGRQPDVVLADYQLRGDLTGMQVLERLQYTVGSHVPSVLLTGDTRPERIAEARESGFDVLHKPVLPGVLRDYLAGLGGARSPIS